ncbi:sarcosine oxidase subunit gamma [Anderseniella sp. Alg231-50]|uniref:sarcosine oxidase subunit gamma n=1 Tax=Anderseniella sp. Alg231-50 TaxID=1922226 RepID=UPI00307C3BC6
MAEMLTQISALDDMIVPGRYGRSLEEGPGVALTLVHPCEVVTVIAAKGKARALAAAVKKDFGLDLPGMGGSATARGMSLHGSAPDQWLALASGAAAGSLASKLEKKLGTLAMVSDQSHGRTVLRMEGSRARDVLTKGTAVDLRSTSFKSGMCAATQIGHVGVLIACTGPDSFELSVLRSFAEGFWQGICELALEWGYEIR